MLFYELEKTDISNLSDGDLRELIARLCEAELSQQGIEPSCVLWGGAQEAADGGVDVHVKEVGTLKSFGFIPRSSVGFQVKKHTMGQAACTKEMLDKKGEVKDFITKLGENKGAYIIASGKDDCSEKMLNDRVDGMKKAVNRLVTKDDLFLDFYGRDRLLSWLRRHPSVSLWVRLRLGKPLSGWKPFGRWTQTPKDQVDDFLSDDHPCVTDINSANKGPIPIPEAVIFLRERLRKSGSAIRITGLSGVGKTRFAQALFENNVGEGALPSTNVIYADLGDELSPSATEYISYLIANNFSSIVVLDNCPSEIHRKLQKQISQYAAQISLLTIEYDISDDTPEETQVIHIEPASEKTVADLVSRRFPELLDINARKISEFAGGNARVALALASRVKPDETLTKFTDESLFTRLFEQRKGKANSLLNDASLLSLVYSFNVSNSDFNNEIEVLALIGKSSRSKVYESHAELIRRQLCQKRGDWRAVLPHALANRLAKRALENVTFNDINVELFKPENFRLFKSCAHRIGYLHDLNIAQELAHTWIQPGAPLHDLSACDDEQIQVVEYIAPVFPEAILTAIEYAALNENFLSRRNQYFDRYIELSCKIAYEDCYFDRAMNIVMKFVGSNLVLGDGANLNRVQDLFSLYLSGTQASPARRQKFLARLLNSGNAVHQKVAVKLFQSAFRTGTWSSSQSFHFGARIRSYGWEPKTLQDVCWWYEGFIEVLRPCLRSVDHERKLQAKNIIASHFTTLWLSVGRHETLEEIVVSECKLEKWSEIWHPIKQTLSLHGKNLSSVNVACLERLEKLTSPSDLHAEVEIYALRSIWHQIHGFNENINEAEKRITDKIVQLGCAIASDRAYLEKIGNRLFSSDHASLFYFGKGLANGATNPTEMFEFLVRLLRANKENIKHHRIFSGVINSLECSNPAMARLLQERVLVTPELLPSFVDLLLSTRLEPWGTELLIEQARKANLAAHHFQQLGHGRAHEPIPDVKLAELIEALIQLKQGAFTALDILSMRFFTENRSIRPSPELILAARSAIAGFLATLASYETVATPSGIERVLAICIDDSTPQEFILGLIGSISENIKSHHLYSHDVSSIVAALTTSAPESLLDYFYDPENISSSLMTRLFRDMGASNKASLNLVPKERLASWCSKDQNKIKFIVNAIKIYIPTEPSDDPLGAPEVVTLSPHVLDLLRESTDKIEILDIVVQRMIPSCWSSLADILVVRLKAFSALLDHEHAKVREYVQDKIPEIESSIRRERQSESVKNTQMEQRFEN